MTPESLPPSEPILAELAQTANESHQAGMAYRQLGLEYFWAAGRCLRAAKARLPHGDWLPWLKKNCPKINPRRAQRYMLLAEYDVTSDLEDHWRRICGNRAATAALAWEAAEETPAPALVVAEDFRVPLTVYVPRLFARRMRAQVRALVEARPFGGPPVVDDLVVEPALTDTAVEALAGQQLNQSHFDRILGGPALGRRPARHEHINVRAPDGRLVLALRRRVLPAQLLKGVYRSLRRAAGWSENRGHYSGIMGFYDYDGQDGAWAARPTAFGRNHPEPWEVIQQLLRAMDEVYASWMPEAYQAQQLATAGNPWLIPGTVFTTGTVNNTADFRAHRDDGNWLGAYSVQTVLKAGEYTGGHLVFLRYRLAVDMGSQDVLFFPADELHGVTAFGGEPGTFQRLSVVGYCRDRLIAAAPRDSLQPRRRWRSGDLDEGYPEEWDEE
jgi:hypothetical protein